MYGLEEARASRTLRCVLDANHTNGGRRKMERNEKGYENIDLLLERAQNALEKIRAQLVYNHTKEAINKHGRTN